MIEPGISGSLPFPIAQSGTRGLGIEAFPSPAPQRRAARAGTRMIFIDIARSDV